MRRCRSNDYARAKELVHMSDILALYRLTQKRTGFIVCPFHSEKTPSMKIYSDSFYCFGCGAGGDIIKFVALMENVGNGEALSKIDAAFGLRLSDTKPTVNLRRILNQRNGELSVSRFDEAYRALTKYHAVMWGVLQNPQADEDLEPHNPLFFEALESVGLLEKLFHEADTEPDTFLKNRSEEVRQIEQRLRDIGGQSA